MPNIGVASRLAFIATMDIGNFMRGSEKLNNAFGRLGQSMTRLGQTLSRSLSLITGLLEGFAVATAASFDELASQLQAVSGGEDFKVLVDDARVLGRTTKFTSLEVLTLTKELKKLGLGVEDTQQAIRSTIGVTSVFGGDLVATGDALTALTRQFQDLTVAQAADVLSVAFRKTALGTENFKEAFKNVGAVANLTGLSFERTTAALGVLANASLKGGRSGTGLKTVLSKLAEGSYDAEAGLLAVAKGGNDFDVLLDTFKLRGVIAAGIIDNLGLEFEKLSLTLEDVEGASEAFQGVLKDKLFFSVARAKAAIQDIGISIGYTLAPFVKEIASALEAAAKRFAEMDAKAAAAQAGTALFAIALGPLIFALGQFTIAVTALLSVTGGVVIVLTALAAVAVRTATSQLLLRGEIASTTNVLDGFNDALESADGNLRGLSTAQLEGQLASLKSRFVTDDLTGDLQDLQQTQEGTTKGFSAIIASVFAASLFSASELAGGSKDAIDQSNQLVFSLLAKAFGVDNESLQFLESQVGVAEDNRDEMKQLIADIQLILDERGAEIAARATENLRLAARLASGDKVNLAAQEDLFAKVVEKLKGTTAAFGVSVGDIKSVFDELAGLDAATIEQTFLGTFPELLEEFKTGGTFEDQIAGIKELAKNFEFAAEGFTQLQAQKIAEFFEQLLRNAEEAGKEIGQKGLVQDLQDATAATVGLAEGLKDLGVETQEAIDKANVQALRDELENLLGIDEPTEATKERITAVSESLLLAEDTLAKTQLNNKLKELRKEIETIRDIKNPFGPVDTAGPISDKIGDLQGRIREIMTALKEADRLNVAVEDLIDDYLLLNNLQGELLDAFRAEQIAKFNDRLDATNKKLEVLDKLGDLGFVAGFEIAKDKVDELTERVKDAQLTIASGGLLGPETLEDLVVRLKEAQKELGKFYLIAALFDGIGQFVNIVADSFTRAKEEGRKFGQVLKESLTKVIEQLIVKLVVLTTLFLLLSAISGGSGALASFAAQATSGGFGAFIGQSLTGNGIPGMGRSTIAGGLGGGGTSRQPAVRVEGLLSGNNIVIANQRGTRAIDRTFG